MGTFTEWINKCIEDCRCKGEINTQNKAEALIEKFAEKLDRDGAGGAESAITITATVNVSSGTFSLDDENKDLVDELNTRYISGKPCMAFLTYTFNQIKACYALKHMQSSKNAYNFYFKYDQNGEIYICPSATERWIVVQESNTSQ